jgi:4-hydroxy-tetrahydrodipicolinate synthase
MHLEPNTWRGVMPAITTPFDEAGAIDHAFLARHAAWLVDAGCTAIIAPGSLGEGNTLTHAERVDLWRTLLQAVGTRVPVVAAIASTSTREAVALARDAAATGCGGLMVLPPYVHKGPWAEVQAHMDAVFAATRLPCMLYNNPHAYGVDIDARQVAGFAARHANLHAVKDSSGDARRITALRAELGDRVACFVGLDDMLIEGVAAGAVGWVAGLVNAMPVESVRLFELAREGRWHEATALYRWFLPLLRMDTVPEFVQLIKLVQAEVGMGSERVRGPRLPVAGTARDAALATIRAALAARPHVAH